MTVDQSYPCPKCGEYGLVYDGMLVWRSGPRPSRKLARKQVGFSPRADNERERCYHCDRCGAQFFQDMELQRDVHLFEEGAAGKYIYNHALNSWQVRVFDRATGKWKMKVFDRSERKWKE